MTKTVKKLLDPPGIKIITDTGWFYDSGTSRPERGLRDYRRFITFRTRPNFEEMKTIKDFLKNNECPGWTPILETEIKSDAFFCFRFSTCWDSSD
jgi:hypothetical protein